VVRRRLRPFACGVIAELLVVGVAATSAAQKKLPAAPVDLNSATIAQLERFPTISPSMAKAIDFARRAGHLSASRICW